MVTPIVVVLKPPLSLVEILQGVMAGPIAMRNTLYNRHIRICVRCRKVRCIYSEWYLFHSFFFIGTFSLAMSVV